MVFKRNRHKLGSTDGTTNTQEKGSSVSIISHHKRRLVVISVLLLVIIGGFATYFLYQASINTATKRADEAKGEAVRLMSVGEFDKSVAKFDEAISLAKAKQQKADIVMTKAYACKNSGNEKGFLCFEDSLNGYDKTIGPDYRSKIAKGYVAITRGEKDKAKTLLTDAVTELNGMSSLTESESEQKAYAEGLLRIL